MVSIEKCKEILGEEIADPEVERLRDSLYAMVDSILDNYFEELATLDICKKQLSTVESPLQNKAPKGMGLRVRSIVAENTQNKETTM
jgi:hypothetical protein